jgi:hypothetical protein
VDAVSLEKSFRRPKFYVKRIAAEKSALRFPFNQACYPDAPG